MDKQTANTSASMPGVMRGPETLIEHCESVRSLLSSWAKAVLDLKRHKEFSLPKGEGSEVADYGEAIANIMLAYRHMEDARMRIGKTIQALDGGISVYDRPKNTTSSSGQQA